MSKQVNNQQGWINILVALVILGVAGIGIYIGLKEVQRTQVLRSRAQEVTPMESNQSTGSQIDSKDKAGEITSIQEVELGLFEKGGFPQVKPVEGVFRLVKNTQYEIGVVGKTDTKQSDKLYICAQRYTTIAENNRDCLEKPVIRLDNLNVIHMNEKGIETRVLYGLSHTFSAGGETAGALRYYIIVTDSEGEAKSTIQAEVY